MYVVCTSTGIGWTDFYTLASLCDCECGPTLSSLFTRKKSRKKKICSSVQSGLCSFYMIFIHVYYFDMQVRHIFSNALYHTLASCIVDRRACVKTQKVALFHDRD